MQGPLFENLRPQLKSFYTARQKDTPEKLDLVTHYKVAGVFCKMLNVLHVFACGYM